MTEATHSLADTATALRRAIGDASRGLIEREVLVELIALSAVAGEHLLVVGPPGTAKSEAVRRVARAVGGKYFEYLLGRFTEPSEIFGPVDLRKLREGIVETETAGMLPEAEVAFLDEVFLGSTAILNTLLSILNERAFRRGRTAIRCPLRVCVGASNGLPEDESLAAFADRFLVRVFIGAVPDSAVEDLLEGGWSLLGAGEIHAARLEDVDRLASACRAADLRVVRPALAHAVRRLRAEGVGVSDRRAVKMQQLVAAAAVMSGRKSPTAQDLWPVVYAVPTAEGQEAARDVLRDLLEPSESASLPAAAAEASLGPRARATRIVKLGEEILAARPAAGEPNQENAEALAAWRLRLEAVGREIDAGFSADARPPEIAALRAKIVDLVPRD